MILVRRKSDGLYIATLEGWDGPDGRPGYRHIIHTLKPAPALRFTEQDAAKICDFDFEGRPYTAKGYNANIRPPEYERVDALNLNETIKHRRKSIRAEAGSES